MKKIRSGVFAILVSMLMVFVMIPPLEAHASTTVTLKPGDHYNFSEKSNYKKYGAYYVKINKEGEYYLTGSASNTMLLIDAPENKSVTVYLRGVNLSPDNTAPGSGSHRAAMEILSGGGTVTLFSDPSTGKDNYFYGQGHMPAIRKDNTDTKLIFMSDPRSPGKIIAKADRNGYRTAAIGCYSLNVGAASRSDLWAHKTGNIWFEAGYIEAWGSQSSGSGYYDGGPGIGANGYGTVDGLNFDGAEVLAIGGDTGTAAIGTASGMNYAFIREPTFGSKAKNITINGGKITTMHYHDVDVSDYAGFAASIGAGFRTDCENLVINGGEVNVCGGLDAGFHKTGVGIGAGDQGNADVEINGGKIEVNAKFVGIGALALSETEIIIPLPDPIDPDPDPDPDAASDPPVNDNEAWFGDAHVDINGGDITVNSDRVCIGSNKPDTRKGYVEIRGGDLKLHSKRGPAIGSYGAEGRLKRITIRGGNINAHMDTGFDDDSKCQSAVIGCNYYTDKYDHLWYSTFVDYIEITGGTVRLTQGDKNASEPTVGKIGGARGESRTDDYSMIVINGGNVYADLLDGEKSRPISCLSSKDGAPVYLQKIRIMGGETLTHAQTEITDGTIRLKHKNNEEYLYGLSDVTTFKDSPQLWFWMPKNAESGTVTTKDKMYSDLDAFEYSGRLRNNGKGTLFNFFPPITLHLLRGETTSDKDGSAVVRVGAREVTDFIGADDSDSPKLIDYYDSEPSGGKHILDRFGGFITGTANTYIDKNGLWEYTGEKSPYDPDVFKKGVNLYAIDGDHDIFLNYDANIPQKTKSTLSGSMPIGQGYHYAETVNLPDDSGFHLNGYGFTGWNTKADGSGTAYEGGQTGIPARQFRPDPKSPSIVKLYAQWEPITFMINYTGGEDYPDLQKGTIEYTYDEHGFFAWTKDLRKWNWMEKADQIAAWKYDDRQYNRTDDAMNFVDFDDRGNPVLRTMTPVFIDEGEIRLYVTTDGIGVSNLDDDISVKGGDGTEYKNIFEELSDSAGVYTLKDDSSIPEGTYTISIRNRRLDQDKATFTYDPNGRNFVELPSFTTTLSGGEKVSSVTLDPYDNLDEKGRPYIVTPAGYKVNITANASEGYKIKGWSFDGEEPVWDPAKVTQDITIKGTSVLTPEIEAARYTVVFDSNGGEGSVEPQEFQVGVAQKLHKSTLYRDGYTTHDDDYYWTLSRDGNGTHFADEGEVPADRPLAIKDGDSVTLYAQWIPKTYKISYSEDLNRSIDPSSASGVTKEKEYSYDKADNLPTAEVIASEHWENWSYYNNYDLYGWQEEFNKKAPILKPGESFTNLCTIDPDTGDPVGKNLTGIWVERGNISLTMHLDNEPYSGRQGNIHLTGENGTVYEDLFKEALAAPGYYVYKAGSGNSIPSGTYTISIDGCEIPQERASFSYDPNKRTELSYDFYTVTVISDGGATAKVNGSTEPAIVLNGSQAAISAETEAGCSFDSWSWLGDDGEPQWEAGKDKTVPDQNITVNKTLELTAHAEGIVYTVVFDSNDSAYPGTDPATGTMNNQDMVYGEPQRLFRNDYSKTGYLFNSWNTKADGSGTSYKNSESVKNLTETAGAKVTLYAIWEPRTYVITYVDPYRLCDKQEQTVKYNETVSLIDADSPEWQPVGHRLHGWQGESLGSFYEPGKQVTNFCQVNKDGTLTGNTVYAVWNDEGNIRVSITLDDIGMDVDPDDIELISENDGTKYSGCFAKDGNIPGLYMFNLDADNSVEEPSGNDGDDAGNPDGANEPDPSGGSELIPHGNYTVHLNNYDKYGLADAQATIYYDSMVAASAFLASDTVTIEAGEHVRSVQVTDPATGTTGDSVIVAYGGKAAVSAVVDEVGYHFGSYSVSGQAPEMDPAEADQEIIVYGPVTLTAQGAPNNYVIHFDANGGDGEMPDQNMTYDAESSLNANQFTRYPYYFMGWNTAANGSGKNFAEKETVINLTADPEAVITLYAQWKEKPKYKTTYDLNGGTLEGKKGMIIVESYEGDVIIVKDAPVRKGYTFDYWKGSKYYPGDRYTVESDHTLSAVWKKNKKPEPEPDPDDHGGGVRTGDDSDLTLWLALLLAGAAGVLVSFIIRRSHRSRP